MANTLYPTLYVHLSTLLLSAVFENIIFSDVTPTTPGKNSQHCFVAGERNPVRNTDIL
jgi:hypothetical protein